MTLKSIDVGRGFQFSEDGNRKHFTYFSGTSMSCIIIYKWKRRDTASDRSNLTRLASLNASITMEKQVKLTDSIT